MRLTHDQAEIVGRDLADHLQNTLLSQGGERLIDDEMFWSDTVQLVLRKSEDVQRTALESEESDGV